MSHTYAGCRTDQKVVPMLLSLWDCLCLSVISVFCWFLW